MLLTIAICILTFFSQKEGGIVASTDILPFHLRIQNAISSYVIYIWKIFWPSELAVYYPYKLTVPIWNVFVSSAIIAFITLVAIYYIKKLPFLFVGWFIFLGTFIPVIGLIQVGSQAMADRYTYLPSIGIAMMLAWGIPSLIKSEFIRKNLLFPMAIVSLIVISALTWNQCGYWKNSIELWKHTLKATCESYLPYYNLGCAFQEKGNYKEAIDNFKKALQILPNEPSVHNNLGNALLNGGDINSAAAEFQETIRLNPNHATAYNNLAMILYNQKQFDSSRNYFQKAINLQPNFANAHYHLALILAHQRLYKKSLFHYNNAIQINPVYGTKNYKSAVVRLMK